MLFASLRNNTQNQIAAAPNWGIWLGSKNSINEMNQIDEINEINQSNHIDETDQIPLALS